MKDSRYALSLLLGDDIKLGSYITMKQPRIGDIVAYGEQEYWGFISTLCSTSYDLMLDLYEAGIDYEEVSDYDLFLMLYKGIDPGLSSIFFGGIDFTTLLTARNNQNDEIVLLDPVKHDVVIDKVIHQEMTDILREMHGMTRNFKVAGNAFTKKFYIQDAKMQREKDEKNPKPFKSTLVNQISTLVNSPEFKYNHETVKNLTVYQLTDSMLRIQAIRRSNQTIQGLYAGRLDGSKINDKDLNCWRTL